ncbi:MAG: LptE family protein [Desulfobulbaceae bacterium]|nr:LptE family protein [Desulfobulbaceae bacterium]
MKPVYIAIPLLFLAVIFSSCGYHNPNVYSGPAKSIYMTEWKNRTSELDIHSKLYRSLTRWYQKSSSISVVRKKSSADLIFAGEIVSIDLPSLSFGIDSRTTEVKVKLRVRYILKEIATNKVIIEVPDEIWTQEYFVGDNSATSVNNEEKALEIILEDLSEKIYRNTASGIPKL